MAFRSSRSNQDSHPHASGPESIGFGLRGLPGPYDKPADDPSRLAPKGRFQKYGTRMDATKQGPEDGLPVGALTGREGFEPPINNPSAAPSVKRVEPSPMLADGAVRFRSDIQTAGVLVVAGGNAEVSTRPESDIATITAIGHTAAQVPAMHERPQGPFPPTAA